MTTLSSCDKLKRKGRETVDKTKEKVGETKKKIVDKRDQFIDQVFPKYDYDKPDTENNKKRFTEHLKIDLTKDVNNIYSYSDFLGVDYKVLFSFNCDKSTIERIISLKKMKRTTLKEDNGLFFSVDFKWWDRDKIELLNPYKVGKEAEYWEYLWYDEENKKAFYEEYSL